MKKCCEAAKQIRRNLVCLEERKGGKEESRIERRKGNDGRRAEVVKGPWMERIRRRNERRMDGWRVDMMTKKNIENIKRLGGIKDRNNKDDQSLDML